MAMIEYHYSGTGVFNTVISNVWHDRYYNKLLSFRSRGVNVGKIQNCLGRWACTCINSMCVDSSIYDGPCPNLLRGDRVLIFVLSDCYSELLQPSDVSSLPDGRNTACLLGCHHSIYNIYYLCCVSSFFYLSAWCGCWFVVYIRRFVYKFFNVCPIDFTAVARIGRLGS